MSINAPTLAEFTNGFTIIKESPLQEGCLLAVTLLRNGQLHVKDLKSGVITRSEQRAITPEVIAAVYANLTPRKPEHKV